MISLHCVFTYGIFRNNDPHTSQENGFSPVCVRLSILKDDWYENAARQCSWENIFSPMCFHVRYVNEESCRKC